MRTLRYRAASNIPYAHAIIALTEHARASTDSFDFGPLTLDALDAAGLAVTGSGLSSVRRLLEQIEGLYLSDE